MATITIKFGVNDANQVYLLENFNEMAERSLAANVDGYQLPYKVEPKADDENNLEFGHRFIKSIVLNTVKANALRTDKFRHIAEVEALDEITENIPNDLLTI